MLFNPTRFYEENVALQIGLDLLQTEFRLDLKKNKFCVWKNRLPAIVLAQTGS